MISMNAITRAGLPLARLSFTAALACGLLVSAAPGALSESSKESRATMSSKKPPAARVEDVVETLHGVTIHDPYRWLEDGGSPEARRFVEAQNRYTHALLNGRPGRSAVRQRLAKLLSIGTIGTPAVRNGRYFYTRREGKENQPILYVRQGLKGKDRVLVDPNLLSKDGTAAIDWWYPSEDGSLLAYGVSTGGDEKSTLRVIDVRNGRLRPDTITRTRYCSLAWVPDGSGFFYTRYPAPGSVPAGEENYNRHLFFHALGRDPEKDAPIYGEGRKPEEMIDVSLSPDGRYLVIAVAEGWSRNDLYVKDLKSEEAPLITIAEGKDGLFSGEVVGTTLYLLTNWKAPRYRLVGVDLNDPRPRRWKTLIHESDGVLSQTAYIGGRIFAQYLRDASSRLEVHDADGAKQADIPLPALGTIETVSGRHDGNEAFFDFSSFTVPPAVYRFDLKTGGTSLWERVKTDVDLSKLEVRQVFYPSKDGTQVSMFLVHRKGFVPDGKAAALLHAYGGFNVSLTPIFTRSIVLWLERGGVYAEANLRGGAEYGEDWHRAGMLGNKQNVFDDFIAAGEWLIANQYTSRDRLAIMGGSNGGLLMGAAITQRPDLYRAVVCSVPLLDMLRYHNFQIAKLWVPEYGSADDPEQFQWLYAYSPYHHVTPGTPYPAILVTTAESDSRVDPMHARKMAALLQASTSSDRPILLRTETRAGHGIGKPLSKQIDEGTDIWTFLLWQTGLEASGGAPRLKTVTGR